MASPKRQSPALAAGLREFDQAGQLDRREDSQADGVAQAYGALAWRHAEIVGSDVRRLNGETLLGLTFRFDAGYHIRDKIVLQSGSKARVLSGRRRLSQLCHAVGWTAVLNNSDQLHGLDCLVRGAYGNRIAAYGPTIRLVALHLAEPMGTA